MRATVDVWTIDLANLPAPTRGDLALLSEDERARHARYLAPEAARIFATTRIALRRLLARRLELEASRVRIAVDRGGRPIVPEAPRTFFNVSHCATLALIAFCDAAPVGIDVEASRALMLEDPLAALLCTPSELAWMRADPARANAVLAGLWTRKEAVLKAAGIGVFAGLAQLELGDPTAKAGIAVLPGHGRVAWCDLPCAPGTVAAVAVHGDDVGRIDVASRTDLG